MVGMSGDEIDPTDPQGAPVELDELLAESDRHSREIVVDHDFPDVKCPNCDNSTFDASNWMIDPEDSERILCRTCGTHILTRVQEPELIKLAEELQDMVYKIDNEGLDYFLGNYIDMVPNAAVPGAKETLLWYAQQAIIALSDFEHYAKILCAEHGINYDIC